MCIWLFWSFNPESGSADIENSILAFVTGVRRFS
jgi:hypothetical protein